MARGRCPLGIQWVDAKDAAKHLQSTGWPPTMKNYLAPNLNSAKDTKPCSETQELLSGFCFVHFPSFSTIFQNTSHVPDTTGASKKVQQHEDD